MSAPDKIYINPEYDLYRTQKNPPFEETYIRKDYLLEWLKMAVECYSHPDTVNVVDTIRCEGKKWAFQDVIDKLNSM